MRCIDCDKQKLIEKLTNMLVDEKALTIMLQFQGIPIEKRWDAARQRAREIIYREFSEWKKEND